ncbi:hypothetical protein ANN_02185 [Periplaneta americana]|uniref:Uncharacterized protein n=1 Tax=Periplaneta americana TaxID=6978 RepID=A0ABQ8TYN7_PERAM|nr:hypothetical protein ANN_02185 [Periplaneta americana]
MLCKKEVTALCGWIQYHVWCGRTMYLSRHQQRGSKEVAERESSRKEDSLELESPCLFRAGSNFYMQPRRKGVVQLILNRMLNYMTLVYTHFTSKVSRFYNQMMMFLSDKVWLQEDFAHFGRRVTAVLNQQFPPCWIGQEGPMTRPPRSPNLSPLGHFLWKHIKSVVYAARSNTKVELFWKIMECSEDLRNDGGVVMRAVNSFTEELKYASTTIVVISNLMCQIRMYIPQNKITPTIEIAVGGLMVHFCHKEPGKLADPMKVRRMCSTGYLDAGNKELEDRGIEQGGMAEAFEEGQSPHRAVEPA